MFNINMLPRLFLDKGIINNLFACGIIGIMEVLSVLWKFKPYRQKCINCLLI
jgi:hypothetical protein